VSFRRGGPLCPPVNLLAWEHTAAHLGEPRSSERGPLIKSEVRLEGRLARGGSQWAGGAPLRRARKDKFFNLWGITDFYSP
jgi:hypothetical protein